MGFVHGKGTAVSLDGQSLSAFSNNVTFSRTADSHDVTTFGKNSKVYRSGLKDGTASIEGIYDNTATTGPGAVLRPLIGGEPVEFVYEPEGTGVGKPLSTVEVIVTSYEEEAPVADMITFTAELQLSDDIADTVGV
jgi:hypothetical protein